MDLLLIFELDVIIAEAIRSRIQDAFPLFRVAPLEFYI